MNEDTYHNHTHSVTLENCDREPIHIPGSIQPHGAIVVFDQTLELIAWSANIESLLNFVPFYKMPLERTALKSECQETIRNSSQNPEHDDPNPIMREIEIDGMNYDFIVHKYQNRIIAEFEKRDESNREVSEFALKAYKTIDQLKRKKSIDTLLQTTVEHIRAITGFDRVMAYKFHSDESGEVIAEAKTTELTAYLGRRYPASDIPAQARRLYTLNSLRFIENVNYQAVPVLIGPNENSLDMSFCVLRSVSPIHLEYLKNMGVTASMSISIVINGELWGLIACHHMSPKKVPYSIRMACDVIAQILASIIKSIVAQNQIAIAEEAANARTQLTQALLHEDDLLLGISKHAELILKSLAADALIIAQSGKVISIGDISSRVATLIVKSLPNVAEDLLQRSTRNEWPTDIQPLLGKWVGMLGLHFEQSSHAWIIALRPEQIETIRWGGRQEKEITHGPLGPRLTPRGSFDEWKEVVRDKAEPWDETTLSVARRLLSELRRICNIRLAEMEFAKTKLLAILGHDLRGPLNSINMAAQLMEATASPSFLSKRIQSSSNRMERLISNILDMSLIEGAGLYLKKSQVNLALLITDLIEEVKLAHPGVSYEINLEDDVIVAVDGDRISQVISNLLSNARHHGELGREILVDLFSDNEKICLQVKNFGIPIDDDLVPSLFSPFKQNSLQNKRNKGGLGLGLYIAHSIAASHGGSIVYEYQSPHIVFKMWLPKSISFAVTGA